jgi:hypothetical protein
MGPPNSQPLLEIAGVLSFEPALNMLVMLLSYSKKTGNDPDGNQC